MMQIITRNDFSVVREKLKGALKSDPLVIMNRIGIYMVGRVARTFQAEGARDEHPKWKELSPLTLILRRNKNKSSIKILSDTGTLRRSIVYSADKNKVEIGTNVDYASIHQEGGMVTTKKGKSLKVPKREFLFITKPDKEMINRIALNYYKERLN